MLTIVTFLFFLFFFLYHVFVVKVQELACSASYGINKTILLAPGKKPLSQVPLVWNQPHISPEECSLLLHADTEKIGKQQESRKQQENPCHSLQNRNKVNLA